MKDHGHAVSPIVEIESVQLNIVDGHVEKHPESANFSEASETLIRTVRSEIVHSLGKLNDYENYHVRESLSKVTDNGDEPVEVHLEELISPNIEFTCSARIDENCVLLFGNEDGGWVRIQRNS